MVISHTSTTVLQYYTLQYSTRIHDKKTGMDKYWAIACHTYTYSSSLYFSVEEQKPTRLTTHEGSYSHALQVVSARNNDSM